MVLQNLRLRYNPEGVYHGNLPFLACLVKVEIRSPWKTSVLGWYRTRRCSAGCGCSSKARSSQSLDLHWSMRTGGAPTSRIWPFGYTVLRKHSVVGSRLDKRNLNAVMSVAIASIELASLQLQHFHHCCLPGRDDTPRLRTKVAHANHTSTMCLFNTSFAISRRCDGFNTFLKGPPYESQHQCAPQLKSPPARGNHPRVPLLAWWTMHPCRNTWPATCKRSHSSCRSPFITSEKTHHHQSLSKYTVSGYQ